MIIGVLVRVVLRLCRRRGIPVPDPSRLRRRPLRLDLTGRLADRLADWADGATTRQSPDGSIHDGRAR